jgi:ABC-type polysaccharide/polyol phosphate transport system ATPase subunit
MMLRLAFAVAVHVNPDILIIDEVIGVGDQDFFAKCVSRIEAFRRSGKTMICVSHSIPTIEAMCDRVLWLDHGRLIEDGSAKKVVESYQSCNADPLARRLSPG